MTYVPTSIVIQSYNTSTGPYGRLVAQIQMWATNCIVERLKVVPCLNLRDFNTKIIKLVQIAEIKLTEPQL